MTAPPPPPPGWYPDPGGAHTQRYFDGAKWTDQLATFNPPAGPTPLPQPKRPGAAKCPRPFVIMAIAGPITFIVTFVLMQLAFGAAAGGGSGSLWFQVVGFALFAVYLASIVATVVGVVGAVVRSVRQHRSG